MKKTEDLNMKKNRVLFAIGSLSVFLWVAVARADTQSVSLEQLFSRQELNMQSQETHPIMEPRMVSSTCYRSVSEPEIVCRWEPDPWCWDQDPPPGRPGHPGHPGHPEHPGRPEHPRPPHFPGNPGFGCRPGHVNRICETEWVLHQVPYACMKEEMVQVGIALDYNVNAHIAVLAEKVGLNFMPARLDHVFSLTLSGELLSSAVTTTPTGPALAVFQKTLTTANIVGPQQKEVTGNVDLRIADAAVLNQLDTTGVTRIHYEADQLQFTTAAGLDPSLAVIHLMVKRDRILGGDTILFNDYVPAAMINLVQVVGATQGVIDLKPLTAGGLKGGRHRIELAIEPVGMLTNRGYRLVTGSSLTELPKLTTALKLKL